MILFKTINILLAISSIIAAPSDASEDVGAETPVIPPADAVPNAEQNQTSTLDASTEATPVYDEIRGFVDHPEMEEKFRKLFLEPKKKGASVSQFIIGGGVAEPGQFPHQALLFIEKEPQRRFLCGGSLIRHNWILTAAHCFHSDFYSAEARLGTALLKGPSVFFTPITRQDVFIHPNYDAQYLKNDIALIHLAQAQSSLLSSPYVGTIELPSHSDNIDLNGYYGVILGFGRFSDGSKSVSNELKYNTLPAMKNSDCELYYPNGNIFDTNICGETSANSGTCEGDSGGPYSFLINGRNVIVGITSFGATLGCESGYPAAFTRVTKYLDWIYSIIGRD